MVSINLSENFEGKYQTWKKLLNMCIFRCCTIYFFYGICILLIHTDVLWGITDNIRNENKRKLWLFLTCFFRSGCFKTSCLLLKFSFLIVLLKVFSSEKLFYTSGLSRGVTYQSHASSSTKLNCSLSSIMNKQQIFNLLKQDLVITFRFPCSYVLLLMHFTIFLFYIYRHIGYSSLNKVCLPYRLDLFFLIPLVQVYFGE